MKTAEETVQEFLFKDKPKRSYCHKRDVKDWVLLLQKFAVEYHDEQVKKLNLPAVSKSVCDCNQMGLSPIKQANGICSRCGKPYAHTVC